MDDFDDDRFAQGPAPLSAALGGTPLRRAPRASGADQEPPPQEAALRTGEDLLEELLTAESGQLAVRVLGRTPAGRIQARAEMQLLAALEVAGIHAAPTVLDLEEDGYVREHAPPLIRRAGRRASENGSPPTAEREAVACARDDLDALVDAVHERGWVLGAAAGQGLGRRTDGSVMLRDLRGLLPSEHLAPRREDRHWVDSVLHDQERTLRRRVDAPHALLDSAPTLAAPLVPPEPLHGGVTLAQAPRGGMDGGAAGPRAPREGPFPGNGELIRERMDVTPEAAQVRSSAELPAPCGSRGQALRERLSAGGWGRPAGHLGRWMRAAQAPPPRRRTALLGTAAVLLAGGLIGTGAWLILPQGAAEAPPAATSAAPVPSPAPAPDIEDPWELAAEIAGARHAYVTGASPQPVAAPGSAAWDVDEEVRAAYDGLRLEGGGPVIHEAALLEGSPDDGTVEMLVTTSMQAHRIREEDESEGSPPRSVAATEAVEVQLTLTWDGSRWLVRSSIVPQEARS